MSRFKGQSVIVTGGGSGIGAATAHAFAREGASVTVADLHEDNAKAVASAIEKEGGHALPFVVDVSDEDRMAEMISETAKAFGGLDVVVNNAGIGEDFVPIDERTSAAWDRVIAVNLTSAFYATKYAAGYWKKEGRGGVIVNVASILGVVGFAHAPAYTAAKHGLVGLTKASALELAPAGIRVVSVNPAFIRTPLIEGMEEAVLPLHPIGRLGESEEVASMILYLSSAEAGFLTGATYMVDGGYTAP
jgi:NAD(P)-dependent dehydrogenase (short-subunit alcohol dehydrogenase family)